MYGHHFKTICRIDWTNRRYIDLFPSEFYSLWQIILWLKICISITRLRLEGKQSTFVYKTCFCFFDVANHFLNYNKGVFNTPCISNIEAVRIQHKTLLKLVLFYVFALCLYFTLNEKIYFNIFLRTTWHFLHHWFPFTAVSSWDNVYIFSILFSI